MDTLQGLSDAIAQLAAQSRERLFHVPSPLGGRTAIGFDGKLLLVPAVEASEAEELDILAPGGSTARAVVRGFDAVRGFAVLELVQTIPSSAWKPMPGLPALGSLVLAAAYPSPQGPEARLDAVRFAGGEGDEAYIQTDGPAFPGFSGAALVAPDGLLAGFVAVDRPGNRGWALPASRAEALVAAILERGFPGRAWLGVSTVPVEAPEALAGAFGDGRKSALMVAGLEARGPAAVAGLMAGDILVSIGGLKVEDPGALRAALDAARPGKPLPVTLVRGGARMELSVTPSASREEGRRGRGHGWGHGGHGPRGWGW
jgi:S1-C subfamily serine protease